MQLKGESAIAAPRQRVWDALNDPEVLARCIEGVESLERTAADRFEGKLNAKVGPVRATFTGAVTLSDIDPPNGYTISGEGKGGVAGFARGSAQVRLTDAEVNGAAGTHLVYEANSNVGGKLAQLGSRLIEGTARGYAETFFARLKQEVEGSGAPTVFAPHADAPVEAAGLDEMPNLGASDTASATATLAAAELESTMAPAGPLPDAPAADGKQGLPPAIWGTLLALVIALMIAYLLLT
jgi:carbon monoxide dehydrogenase subunit G